MARMADSSMEEKVQKFLESVGTPLEMRVLEAFAEKNVGRMPGLRYIANESLREIDLVASFEDHFLWKGDHISLWSSMVIECKKSPRYPWVFFTSDSYTWPDARPFLMIDAPLDDAFSDMGRVAQIVPSLRGIDDSHLADSNTPLAINYEEAFKRTGTPSSIYSAVDSVATYLQYVRARRNQVKVLDDAVDVYFPVIVLEGELMVAKREGDAMAVEQVDHVHLRTWTGHDLLLIDVVTPAAFEQLVEDVSKFHTQAMKVLANLALPDEIHLKLRVQNLERERSRSQ